MKTVTISHHEAYKAIQDPTLYLEFPEFAPTQHLYVRYQELIKMHADAHPPQAGCCGGSSSVSPAADATLRNAVDSFINVLKALPLERKQAFKKRLHADSLLIQYKDPITKNWNKSTI